jgi:hypothetical protein
MTEREFIQNRLNEAEQNRIQAMLYWPEDVLYYDGRIHELEWFLSLYWSIDGQNIDAVYK